MPLMPCATSPSAMPFTSSTCRPHNSAIWSKESEVFSTSHTAVAFGISSLRSLIGALSKTDRGIARAGQDMQEMRWIGRLIARRGRAMQLPCRICLKKLQCSNAASLGCARSCPAAGPQAPLNSDVWRQITGYRQSFSAPALSMPAAQDLLRRKLEATSFAARHERNEGKAGNERHQPAGLLLRGPRSRHGSELRQDGERGRHRRLRRGDRRQEPCSSRCRTTPPRRSSRSRSPTAC